MRILPSPWVGLRPAFPVRQPKALAFSDFYQSNSIRYLLAGLESPSSLTGVTELALAPSIVAIVYLSYSVRRGRPAWNRATKIATYGFAAIAGVDGLLEIAEMRARRAFLYQRGIQIPRRKLYDRLGYYDPDDARIAGAAAGPFIAHQLPRPWAVTGLTRWTGAAVFGMLCSMTLFHCYHYCQNPGEYMERRARNFKATEQMDAWRPQVYAAWLKSLGVLDWTQERLLSRQAISESAPASVMSKVVDPPAMAKTAETSPTSQKLAADGSPWKGDRNESHLTSGVDFEGTPAPCANRNYEWTPTPGKAFQELDAHVVRLYRGRKQLVLELEKLSHRVADKEAEYYNLRKTKECDEMVRRRRYLEILGFYNIHPWMEIGKYDWMIADSRIYLDQLRCEGRPGGVRWLPHLSSEASAAEPQYIRVWLESSAKMATGKREALALAKAAAAASYNSPDPKAMRMEKVLDQATGNWTDAAVIQGDLLVFLEAGYKNECISEEALTQLERDLKNISRRSK